VFTEATAVLPEARISPGDTGIYNDRQVDAWRRIAAFVQAQGAAPGIQLAHAGRKASTAAPWLGGKMLTPEKGGWEDVVGPSPVAFTDGYLVPHELDDAGLAKIRNAFHDAAVRAVDAGFKVFELHAAHGYLIHEFLSPLSNHRQDEYGGSLQNRMRLAIEIAETVRHAVPDELPVFTRISATDYTDGGWTPEDSVELGRELRMAGVDLIDCSSGGNVADAKIPIGPGYQVPFAAKIRREAGIATGAVGMILEPAQASQIIASESADLVLLAREMLRDPYWPRRAAHELSAPLPAPAQYARAW
jgi:2,4-dienoyl-CoA reductase-like NADH-dependent reductase (Old Yellow Enzyme family)